jgi:hypothetical protein
MGAVICLSFDQDWAPPWATLAILERLEGAGLPGTFFVTHDCPCLERLRASPLAELGWHPNFLPGSSHGGSFEEVLCTMERMVPGARGARAHALMRGTPLLLAYRERGLLYDASDIHDGATGLRPFVSWTGLVRLPIFFEDDVHLQRGLPCRLEALDLDSDGLKVFNLHPVLVTLNASSTEDYEALKKDLQARGVPLTDASEEDVAAHRRDDREGIADLLDALLGHLARHPDRRGGKLEEVARAALAGQPPTC